MKKSVSKKLMVGFAALVLVSCGGGSDSNSSNSEDGSENTSIDGDASLTTVADIPGVSEGCEDVVNLVGAAGQIMAGQVEADAAESTLERFKDAVPDVLANYAEVFVDAYSEWIQVLDEYSNDMTAVYSDPAAMAKLEKLNSPEVEEAFNVIGDYVSDECGFGN